jgi:transposase
MNTSDTTAFAATIGLDWADRKHDLWICPAGQGKAEHLRLEQKPAALHEWVAKLRERFSSQRVAIAVETSRGPVLSALLAYDFIVLFPVNPKCLKDYRAAFCVSGAKDDRTDAILLEEMVRLHRDKLNPLEPDTELTRKLAGLVENRRHLVDERTRLVNQLHSTLKTYFPLALDLLEGQMNTLLAARFLLRWPTLAAAQAAQPAALRAFFYKHHSRDAKRIEERIQAVAAAKPLTTDAAIIEPASALVSARAGMLQPLHQAIQSLDTAIANAMDQHPDAPIFRSLPGAGPALAPRLLVAFGTNRQRFASAAEVAQFYGIAPVIKQSGNSKTVHVRYRCPKFGRQSFHENAACALKREPWARSFYEGHKKKHNDKHHPACRALAFKLIRVYFACWRDRKTYQSNRYLQALQKNGSPLHHALNPQTTSSSEQPKKTS